MIRQISATHYTGLDPDYRGKKKHCANRYKKTGRNENEVWN